MNIRHRIARLESSIVIPSPAPDADRADATDWPAIVAEFAAECARPDGKPIEHEFLPSPAAARALLQSVLDGGEGVCEVHQFGGPSRKAFEDSGP